jgi:hypothetical protein
LDGYMSSMRSFSPKNQLNSARIVAVFINLLSL